MTDTVLLISAGLLVMAGIGGCILPFIPGPPLSFLGLLLLQLSSRRPFEMQFLVVYAVLTLIVLIFDFIMPVLTVKSFNASSYGIRGSIIGLIAGFLLFPPFGIILGPVAGAFIGEILSGKNLSIAVKSSAATLAGYVAGTAVKLALSVLMAYHFFASL